MYKMQIIQLKKCQFEGIMCIQSSGFLSSHFPVHITPAQINWAIRSGTPSHMGIWWTCYSIHCLTITSKLILKNYSNPVLLLEAIKLPTASDFLLSCICIYFFVSTKFTSKAAWFFCIWYFHFSCLILSLPSYNILTFFFSFFFFIHLYGLGLCYTSQKRLLFFNYCFSKFIS